MSGPSKDQLHITKLPIEILIQLPHMVNNLDDLYSLLSTCRLFYRACAAAFAKLPPGQKVDRRLTMAGTARQVANWATESEENKGNLQRAILQGSDGLLQLTLRIARLGLDDMRELHKARKAVVGPLANKLQENCEMCGEGRFYKKHCTDITTALYDFVTYCELFFRDIHSFFDEASAKSPLGESMRLDWISHCVHDVSYQGYRRKSLRNQRFRNLQNLLTCHDFSLMTFYIVLPAVHHLHPPTVNSRNQLSRHLSVLFSHQGMTTLDMLLHKKLTNSVEQNRLLEDFSAVVASVEIDQNGRYVMNDNWDCWVWLSEDLARQAPELL